MTISCNCDQEATAHRRPFAAKHPDEIAHTPDLHTSGNASVSRAPAFQERRGVGRYLVSAAHHRAPRAWLPHWQVGACYIGTGGAVACQAARVTPD